jgi:sulfoxide reductase catalytic subunit YedY
MSHPSNLPEREATPEAAFLSRRRWLKWACLSGLAALAGAGGYRWWYTRGGAAEDVLANGRTNAPVADLYPAPPNERFARSDRPITDEVDSARFCNFYEFAAHKAIWREVKRFRPVPWTLEITGLVARPQVLDLDQLVRAFPLEERVYRHRCVETWAMVVPWTGFPLSALLRRVEPLPEARFVRFVSFQRPEEASHQSSRSLPWPYTEGLTLPEAGNELTFLATGAYGHPLLKQNGAPIRLVVPWKYGYKSAKSIVRMELTAEQPRTFWNTMAPDEYGFESNVDPKVPHPRWSQARERMLGTGEERPTVLYNGYGEWVASLYG